jgi:excisionase family DNA binding protein
MTDRKQIEPRLLDYKQAADYLSIGKSTLYSLVSGGQLTCVRFGAGKTKRGVTRFRREDLESFVKARVRRAQR